MKFSRRIFTTAVILLTLAFLVRAQSPPQIAGCVVFPANNIWNTPVDQPPVDANSTAYINTIGGDGFLHPDFGTERYYIGG